MSKSTITRLFVAGTVVVIAAVVLMIAAIFGALATGGWEWRDGTFENFTPNSTTWLMIGLIVISAVAITCGAIAGLIAWIGALLNTVQLEDKTWFVLLLVLGLFSFGFIAMIAYVIAGPDGAKPVARANLTIDLGRPA